MQQSWKAAEHIGSNEFQKLQTSHMDIITHNLHDSSKMKWMLKINASNA